MRKNRNRRQAQWHPRFPARSLARTPTPALFMAGLPHCCAVLMAHIQSSIAHAAAQASGPACARATHSLIHIHSQSTQLSCLRWVPGDVLTHSIAHVNQFVSILAPTRSPARALGLGAVHATLAGARPATTRFASWALRALSLCVEAGKCRARRFHRSLADRALHADHRGVGL